MILEKNRGPMLSKEIRRKFLHYFKTQSHTIVPSSPVVPFEDPTLLFTNAGMNQFKDVFLGKSKRPYVRATSSQKCVRVGGKHNDLENVGHTTRHLTFFEMLGNFSFGDYFKKEAIGFAWDVSTHIFSFDPEKIWVSVYKDDEESYELWKTHIPEKRIVRLGEKDNFWSMGDTGPCGPCTELLYDRGEKYSDAKSPYEDAMGERFLEFWNVVFMQYNRDENKNMPLLPKQSVDTGAGLERIVALSLGVDTVFETDILQRLIRKTEQLSSVPYNPLQAQLAPAFHVIADHIRTLSFAIADGAQPSNVDRGYVLRKLLRRAVRYGRMLGLNQPFLAELVPTLREEMGEDFPELITSQGRIQEILTLEEESFLKTLHRGGNLLSQVIAKSDKIIQGDDAFKLKDTYGFPIEEIELIAKDEHLKVDLKRFQELEEEAKEKSRKAQKCCHQTFDQNFFSDFCKTHKASAFVGHTQTESSAKILGMIVDGCFTDSLKEDEEGILILDRTPFYPEMGGQIGDTGKILHEKGASFEVTSTQSPYPGVIVHEGKLQSGALQKQDTVTAVVDSNRRQEISCNHTATHLLHWALEKVLGEHIRQAGSLVEDERLRFDFHHHKGVSKEELRQVEKEVNRRIRQNQEVCSYEKSFEEIQKLSGIKQFFGEKYGDIVRVIDIEFSKELCGGTHVKQTGDIGLLKITKESSIAAGIRRIEAVTGKYAEQFIDQQEDLLDEVAQKLKTKTNLLLLQVDKILDEKKSLVDTCKQLQLAQRETLLVSLLKEKESLHGIPFIGKKVNLPAEDILPFMKEISLQMPSGVIALAIEKDSRATIFIQVSSDLMEKGIFANDLTKLISPIIEGGGGGKKEFAQAGGKNAEKIFDALEEIKRVLTKS